MITLSSFDLHLTELSYYYYMLMIIIGNDSLQINKFLKAHLARYFQMKILGTLTNFIQLEIQKSSRGIHVHQRKYAEELLALAHLRDSRTVDTPLELNVKY